MSPTTSISTGFEIKVSNQEESRIVFGGDTFIGVFDYTSVYASDNGVNGSGNTESTSDIWSNQIKHIGAMIPLESSINMHLVNSKSYVASGYNFAIQNNPGVYSPGSSSGSSWSVSQDYKQYSYNAAYSSENTSIGYLSSIIGSESNKTFDCRIYSSEIKTNDEVYDSWANFKLANYIDVDSEHGEVTGIYKFNNKLFFWQENSFGVLSVNERSLIKDNNISSLTLGTGGILSRFDYISTNNGLKRGVINGIANSINSIYWYDHDRAEVCTFDNNVNELSKAKGIQSVLNKSKLDIDINIPIVFDRKYNEVNITLNGISDASQIE